MTPFSQAEFEALAESIHIMAFGLDVPFEYSPWMNQLCPTLVQQVNFTPDLIKAYKAGYQGDLQAVENYVGGMELADEDDEDGLYARSIKGIRVETLVATERKLNVTWSPIPRSKP